MVLTKRNIISSLLCVVELLLVLAAFDIIPEFIDTNRMRHAVSEFSKRPTAVAQAELQAASEEVAAIRRRDHGIVWLLVLVHGSAILLLSRGKSRTNEQGTND